MNLIERRITTFAPQDDQTPRQSIKQAYRIDRSEECSMHRGATRNKWNRLNKSTVRSSVSSIVNVKDASWSWEWKTRLNCTFNPGVLLSRLLSLYWENLTSSLEHECATSYASYINFYLSWIKFSSEICFNLV